jgi:uncharacterized protein (TIGR03083 family)
MEHYPINYLVELESATTRFARILAEGDLDAPVPSCPDWTLFQLADHLGEIHQWANHAVVAGNPDADTTPAPTDRSALVDWYQEAAGTLLTTLRATPVDAPAWGFGPKPRTVAFWHRRQVNETTMHLWDACNSQSLPMIIPDVLALDGIDEVVRMFFPRQVRLGRIPALERSVALRTDGPSGPVRWVIAGDGTGSADPAKADVTVSGPAETLLFLVWRRTGTDNPQLAIQGDEALVRAVLDSPITP